MKNLIATEIKHFRALGELAQKMLVSITIYEFVYPITYLFVNTFILRSFDSIFAVALYNLGMFITLPIAFYLNGWLLKRVKLTTLYFWGTLGQGLVTSFVFFFSLGSLPALFLFGLIFGFPFGFYWSNRNFLSLEATHDENRNYYGGLETTIGTVAGLVAPFLLGWLIVGGEKTGWYSTDIAYRLGGTIAVVFLYFAGSYLQRAPVEQPIFQKLWLRQVEPSWIRERWVEFFRGIQNGFDFMMPSLLVFTFLGKEGILGSLQSLSALLTAVVLYFIARFSRPHQRIKLLTWGVLGLILLSITFALHFQPFSALLYALLVSSFWHINWILSNPISQKVIDQQENGDPTNNYAYVVDRELFLNIGRIAGVAIFFGIMYASSSAVALRIAPLIAAVCQLGLLYQLKKLA